MMGIKKVFWIDESQTIDEGLKNCLEELGLELHLVKKVTASDIPNIGESIFIVKTIPSMEPKIVPLNPIKVPTSKNILKIELSLLPIVLSTAISLFLFCTKINRLVTILNAAIMIISDNTKNINSRSVASTSQKELFRSIQSFTK